MKKAFFLIALLFTVVCYASPPPIEVPCYITDDVGCVVQDIQDVANVSVYTFEAREVAFTYNGNFELVTCESEFGLKQVNDLVVPEATVIDLSYLQLTELNKPPANQSNVAVAPNFKLNRQNDNYGYPLTGDMQI